MTPEIDLFGPRSEGPTAFWKPRRLAYAVLALALVLRLFSITWPPFYVFIEQMHVESTNAYVEAGHFNPENDHAGPARKILQYPTLKLFGDTPLGRRLPNVIFGGLTAFFLTLLGLQLFPQRKIGVLAGVFLATDPFHISFSRTTGEDIPAALFIVAALYFLAKALAAQRPDRYLQSLLASGAFFALALTTRRYTAALLLVTLVFLVYREFKGGQAAKDDRPWRRVAFLAVVFGLLPLLLYAATFYPWFTRGFSPAEWLSFQTHMVKDELTDTNMELSEFGRYYGKSYRAIDWFTRPVAFGYRYPVTAATDSTILLTNNPFSWFLVWPAGLYLAWLWRKTRAPALAFILGAFALVYFPFLPAARIILIYSSLAVLPLAFLLLAGGLEVLSLKWFKPAAAVAIAIVVTNLALFPLATGVPLPKSVDRFIPYKSAIMSEGKH